MRKAIVFFCLMISGLLQAQVTFNPDYLNTIAKGEQDAYARKLRPAKGITTSAYNVIWYRCFWIIDPNIKEISGNVTVLFKPLITGFDSLVLDMNQALAVDSVKYHNNPVNTWVHDTDQLIVRFANPFPPSTADSVTVFYHGVPPDNGFGSFVQSTHNGAPVIWTLSEPYGASDWWPCKNGLPDKDARQKALAEVKGYLSAGRSFGVRSLSAWSGQTGQMNGQPPNSAKSTLRRYLDEHSDAEQLSVNQLGVAILNYSQAAASRARNSGRSSE